MNVCSLPPHKIKFDSRTFWATIVCTFFHKVFAPGCIGTILESLHFVSLSLCHSSQGTVTWWGCLSKSLEGQARHHYKIARSTTLLYELNFYFKLIICKNLVAICMQNKQKCVGVHFCQHFMIKPLVHSMHPYFTVHKACCSKVNSIHQQFGTRWLENWNFTNESRGSSNNSTHIHMHSLLA